MNEILTNKMCDFDTHNINELSRMLNLFANKKFTAIANNHFYKNGKLEFYKNKSSGLIFISDEDYNTILINPKKNKLDLWINTPYYGIEGFLSIELINDIFGVFDNCIDDIEYLNNFKEYMSRKELNLFNKYIKKYKISLD